MITKYSFQKYSDASTLTENVNNVVYEARTCFNFATNLFKDIDKFIQENKNNFDPGNLTLINKLKK